MIKRIAGMLAISAALCAAVAAQPVPVTEDTGSTQKTEPIQAELVPNSDPIEYDMAQTEFGAVRELELKDTLTPASDYDRIFPYAAQIIGWKQDGTAVYRYAMADEAGEQITNPVYTSVKREACSETAVWILENITEDGKQISCAAEDGSWVIGPIYGSIQVTEGYVLVQRSDTPDTKVYKDGELLGTMTGTMVSCSDGIFVSRKTTEQSDIWYIYEAEDMEELAELTAYQIGAFSDGYATMQTAENQWAVVDTHGVIIPFGDAAWMDEVCNGYVLVQNTKGKFGVAQVSGKEAVAFDYINGTHCSEDYPLYQLWESETECQVISANKGQKLELPEDVQAQKLTALPDNYFAYLDADGCSVIFDDLKRVVLDGEAQFYEQKDMLICATADGYQLFDLEDGSVSKLIAYQYTSAEENIDSNINVFPITDPKTGLQGIGNIRGRMVLQPEYDSICCAGGSYYMAIQDGWSGIVDSNGRWLVRIRLAGANREGNDK